MAGLLEMFGASTGDPSQDAAINQGLLQAGLSLLQSKGNLGSALGQAGMAGLQGAQQSQQLQFQKQMQQYQLDDIKRRHAMQQLPQQFARSPMQTALAGGGGPTLANAQKLETAQPSFDYQGYTQALAGYDPVSAVTLQAAMRKDKTPVISKPGDIARDQEGNLLWQNEAAPEKEPEALRTLGIIYGKGSPQYQKAAHEYAAKITTHPAGVNVTYGAPVAGVGPDGQPVFFQPSKGGGAPSIIPGVRPSKDAREKDLTESQAKATAFLGQMQSASTELVSIGADQSALSMQAETALAGGPANIAIGQKAQRVRQAQDQWSEAFLRFKTGAASTPAEVKANRETFFPKFGDKPENIEQKRRMRQQAEADMAIAAGRGAGQLAGRDAAAQARQVKRTGMANGRKVVEYSDGSIEYAD